MKTFHAILIAAAVLLLPGLSSCTYSNIGSCIRNSGLVHTGVDVRHPVDGKMYQTPEQRRAREGKAKEAYVRAPELSYRLNHPLFISYNIKGDFNKPEPYDIRPTGKTRLALARNLIETLPGGGTKATPWLFRKSVESIPASARAYTVKSHPEDRPALEDDLPQPRPAWWRYAAAAPFDYLIDPAITVVWNTASYTVSLAALPLVMTWESISYQYFSEPPPPAPPAPVEE